MTPNVRRLAFLLTLGLAACGGIDDENVYSSGGGGGGGGGCASGTGGSLVETENNGSIGTANGTVTYDALISGAISPAGDYDYFAVKNAGATAATVSFETFTSPAACPSADTVLEIYDGAGVLLTSNDDGGINFCSLATYSIPPCVTVYVRVRGFGSSTIPAYQLQVNFP